MQLLKLMYDLSLKMLLLWYVRKGCYNYTSFQTVWWHHDLMSAVQHKFYILVWDLLSCFVWWCLQFHTNFTLMSETYCQVLFDAIMISCLQFNTNFILMSDIMTGFKVRRLLHMRPSVSHTGPSYWTQLSGFHQRWSSIMM